METLHFPSFPPSSSRAHIALFSSLSPLTLSNLRQQIIDASLLPPSDSPDCTPAAEAQREAVNFAFLNPHLITSKLHLQTAIYQAILAETGKALRTKTVHSEILWALNPTNNISEAIRRYGLPSNSSSNSNSSDSTALLVVRVCGSELSVAEAQEKMARVVQGTLVPLDTLGSLTDWATIKKYHKLNNESWTKNISDVGERQAVDNIVISTVAMKSVAT
ncbi:CGI-121-domain-containing protein [Amanita rubescens]|nr:CGI-121-domain-containing protein [Amanita rubescens]